jgi:hypothetical protein
VTPIFPALQSNPRFERSSLEATSLVIIHF